MIVHNHNASRLRRTLPVYHTDKRSAWLNVSGIVEYLIRATCQVCAVVIRLYLNCALRADLTVEDVVVAVKSRRAAIQIRHVGSIVNIVENRIADICNPCAKSNSVQIDSVCMIQPIKRTLRVRNVIHRIMIVVKSKKDSTAVIMQKAVPNCADRTDYYSIWLACIFSVRQFAIVNRDRRKICILACHYHAAMCSIGRSSRLPAVEITVGDGYE